jgi:hypothetical protein
MTMRQKIFYRIGQGAGLILVLTLFWSADQQNNFTGWRAEPQPEIGRTIPSHVKGAQSTFQNPI